MPVQKIFTKNPDKNDYTNTQLVNATLEDWNYLLFENKTSIQNQILLHNLFLKKSTLSLNNFTPLKQKIFWNILKASTTPELYQHLYSSLWQNYNPVNAVINYHSNLEYNSDPQCVYRNNSIGTHTFFMQAFEQIMKNYPKKLNNFLNELTKPEHQYYALSFLKQLKSVNHFNAMAINNIPPGLINLTFLKQTEQLLKLAILKLEKHNLKENLKDIKNDTTIKVL